MKTKDKILAMALQLFNTEGHEAVTTRQIAQALGISQGNLCYHFSHKQDLVMALYQALVLEFDQTLRHLQQSEFGFFEAFVQTQQILSIQYRYQFLMHDFVAVMRGYPEIRSHFKALQSVRQEQLRQIFGYLNAKGWAALPLESAAFTRLVEQYFIVGNAWMNDAEILGAEPEQDLIAHYSEILLGLLYPWLTAKGKSMFDQDLARFKAIINPTAL
jgi:AcrR family transcriptional regulator